MAAFSEGIVGFPSGAGMRAGAVQGPETMAAFSEYIVWFPGRTVEFPRGARASRIGPQGHCREGPKLGLCATGRAVVWSTVYTVYSEHLHTQIFSPFFQDYTLFFSRAIVVEKKCIQWVQSPSFRL